MKGLGCSMHVEVGNILREGFVICFTAIMEILLSFQYTQFNSLRDTKVTDKISQVFSQCTKSHQYIGFCYLNHEEACTDY